MPPGWIHIPDCQGRTFTGTFHRDGKDTHSGAYAIRLVNTSDDDAVHVKQVLPVDGTLLSVGRLTWGGAETKLKLTPWELRLVTP